MHREPRQPLPPLEAGLDVVVDPGSEEPNRYILRDPASGRVWQLGAAERGVLRLLDGTFSLDGVWNALAQQEMFKEVPPPSRDEIAAFIGQLAREGLLGGELPDAWKHRGRGGPLSLRRITTYPIRSLLRWLVVLPWDILSLGSRSDTTVPRRVRFGNPDHVLAAAARLLRPLLGRFAFAAALVWGILGLGILAANFERWWDSVLLLWNPWAIAAVAVIGIFLVHVPHQVVHGLICVDRGARVPSWGFRFLFHVIPTLWFDISDLVWLDEKRKRLEVIGVGLLFQLAALATGLAGWLITDRGTFFSIVFLAVASTAFFGLVLNANPLAQRDGYQLLSAWLEVPDLRARAREHLRAWVRWQPAPEPLTRRERSWFGIYAAAVNVFGIALTVITGIFAFRVTEDYGETGAISVAFAAGLVFQDHIRTVFDKTGIRRVVRGTPRILRWALRIAAAAVIVWVLLLPYPYRAGGDAELVPDQLVEIRTEMEGLVDEVYVREGDWVEAGDPVATLVTHLQERNLHAAEARLAETMARRSAIVAGFKPEEIHRAKTAVFTAQARLAWSKSRADRFSSLYEQEIIGIQEYENAVQLQLVNERELEEAKAYLQLVESGARPETLEAVEAEVDSLEAIVEHYRGDIERTVLVSPITGQVTTPQVEHLRGRYLKPGQRDLVATIEDTRTIVAEIMVPEEDIEHVAVGNEVTLITWSHPGRAFEGRVREIAPVASNDELQQRKVVRVLTEIPNPDGLLKPEMTGFAKIETNVRPVWDVLFRPLWRWLRIEVWSWIP